MGCDIHLFVEIKSGPQLWQRVERSINLTENFGGDRRSLVLGWGDTRNYDAFAMLANVRNGYGFAGVDTGEGFEPIAMPKGLPSDASWEVHEEADDWGVDGHSHTWFTLRELLDLEESGYWDKTTIRRGVIQKHTLEQAKADGIVSSIEGQTVWLTDFPRTMAGAISGPGIGPSDLWECHINVTYRQSAGWLYETTIPAMTEIASNWRVNGLLRNALEEGPDGRKGYPTVIRDKSNALDHWVDSAEMVRAIMWFDN